ncbi:MAG: NAD(P)H-hydrate dehydratase [Bacteroidota bacterium]
MNILSAWQIYEADEFTIKSQQLTSEALMERAATGLFNWINERLQARPVPIHIFCGIGNNGGDGLALARQLKALEYAVQVYVVNYSKKRAPDFLTNLQKLEAKDLWPTFLEEDSSTWPTIQKGDFVVDALFGIGLSRPPSIWVGQLMQYLNTSGAFILSVDVPSGVFMDQVPVYADRVVKADCVLSFQWPKLPFFLPETATYARYWELLDLGLDQGYLSTISTDYQLIEVADIQSFYKPREKFSHKGNYGHAMIVGGSYGKIGAIALATKACLTSGAGLVTAFVPESGRVPLQTGVPEAMVITDDNEAQLTAISFPFQPKVVGIGMGMGVDKATVKAFERFMEANTIPLVVDADAINILGMRPELLKKLPEGSVLTPHPKELKRLIGEWNDDFEKLEMAKRFSLQYRCVLVIKGACTITFYGGVGYINNSGNPGMATAGSGDVLSGMITALVAQGYPVLKATLMAVYLHGRAGDLAVAKLGYEAIIASRLIENIGPAFVSLYGKEGSRAKRG